MSLNDFYVKVKYQDKVFSCRPQLPLEISILKPDGECGGWVHKSHLFLQNKERYPILFIIWAVQEKLYSSCI